MIVFDLKCEGQDHVFEAWFGSSADYESQKARGLLACPMCGDTRIVKAVMAPAVAAKGNSRRVPSTASEAAASEAPAQGQGQAVPVATGADDGTRRMVMEALAKAQSKALEASTWVGRGFAEQARAMHYGEQPRDSIHGEVAPEEARALIAEGVEVAPLPFPVVPPQAKN